MPRTYRRLHLTILSFIFAALMTQTGCAALAFRGPGTSFGWFYADTDLNQHVTQNKLGTKHGESCALSVLGWVTTGDASAAAAARQAQITEIASVDNHYTNVLGLFARYCTTVSGD